MQDNTPIMVTIVGSDEQENTITLSTRGTLEERAAGWALRYTEMEVGGLDAIDNLVEVESGGVMITRSGTLGSTILYRENKPFEGEYMTPFGDLFLRVLPTTVRAQRRGGMGHIHLEYLVGLSHDKEDADASNMRMIDIRFRAARAKVEAEAETE